MKRCDLHLYRDVSTDYTYDVPKLAPKLGSEALNYFVMQCLFFLEAKNPEFAFIIIKYYNLDGCGSLSMKKIGKLLGNHSDQSVRLKIAKSIQFLRKHFYFGFDARLLTKYFRYTFDESWAAYF